MQSSLWKLLTAAGIIGIGTLVVLEVQNRLPIANSSTKSQVASSTGTEISVTPDASTELDRALAAADSAIVGEPSSFDKPGVGSGRPAPPADDTLFVGTVDQTVRKDELTDNPSPFAMEEPSFDTSDESTTAAAEAPSSIFSNESNDTPEGNPVKTASFQPGKPQEDNAIPELSLPAAGDDPTIPFPDEASTTDKERTAVTAPKPTPELSKPSASDTGAAKGKTGEKNTMMFFPNGGNSNSSTNPAPAAPKSANDVPPRSSGTSTSITPAVTSPKQTVQLVSGTASSDEVPSLMFPEEVPDVTDPALRTTPEPDTTPAFDDVPFSSDPAAEDREPAVPRRESRPTTPARTDALDPDFFSGDAGEATPPRRPAENPVEDGDSRDLPFMPNESDTPSPRTEPRRPAPASDLPEPRLPATTPRSDRDSFDPGSTDEPFGLDRDIPADGELLPLPSADDLPARTDRDRGNRDLPARGSDSAARTTSEVMRPQLTIQKRAPDTATVGVSHDYTIVVSNDGQSPAYDVIVEDELGTAAEFVDSRPVAKYNQATGQLEWNVNELLPGDKQEITVRIKPTGEGTLDGVATVRFKAQVKSATVITAPKLELDLTGPSEVKVGDEVPLQFTIRNRGTGDATNVILRSVLPPGLKHPEGGDLEYEIEVLRAGESEDIDLTVVAAEPGDRILIAAEVTSSGISAAKARTEVEIVGAQLTLERRGPERRYVGRAATYQNIVSNDSKFEATNAIVVEELPEGMRFVSASNGGEYNADNRRIRWTIPRLAAGKQAVLEVELVAEVAGKMETIVEVTENAGFRTPLTENTVVTVEDFHNVTADISRQDAPVAIGERFGFTVTIDNRGTAVAKNVEMSVQVPLEIKVLAAGTRQVQGHLMPGNIVKYNVVQEIPPNESMTFQLTLQGEKPMKNALVQAYLKYDEMPEPLIVSESVTIFDDRP